MKTTSIAAAAGLTCVGLMTAVWPSLRIPGIVTPVHAKSHGCTIASLQGPYGVIRTGINNVVGGPIARVGLITFNGDGTFGGVRETASTNGEILDWTDMPETATYTVDPDCTGSVFNPDGTKGGNIVIVNGGREFFLLVTMPGRIITSMGKKVEAQD